MVGVAVVDAHRVMCTVDVRCRRAPEVIDQPPKTTTLLSVPSAFGQ